jgi:hypothetical protein
MSVQSLEGGNLRLNSLVVDNNKDYENGTTTSYEYLELSFDYGVIKFYTDNPITFDVERLNIRCPLAMEVASNININYQYDSPTSVATPAFKNTNIPNIPPYPKLVGLGSYNTFKNIGVSTPIPNTTAFLVPNKTDTPPAYLLLTCLDNNLTTNTQCNFLLSGTYLCNASINYYGGTESTETPVQVQYFFTNSIALDNRGDFSKTPTVVTNAFCNGDANGSLPSLNWSFPVHLSANNTNIHLQYTSNNFPNTTALQIELLVTFTRIG